MTATERRSPLGGRRPTRDELAAFDGAGLDDVLGPGELRLLVVGINPGLWTAAVNAPFAHPGNRFWPSLAESGLLPRRVDASTGLSVADQEMLFDAGIGITNLVARATARADELSTDELRAGRPRLEKLVAERRPRVVALLGITAYRAAFEEKKAKMGRQPAGLAGAEFWVMPQPSGLNAHATMPVLVDWWRQVADAAGISAAD